MCIAKPCDVDFQHPSDRVVSVSRRSGVWSVTLDGGFYGDFLRKERLLEALRDTERELVASGGRLKLIFSQEAADAWQKSTSGLRGLLLRLRRDVGLDEERLQSIAKK